MRRCHVDAFSILFSVHPFAKIWSAVLKLHPIRFTASEKAHRVATDQTHVFQIKNDVPGVRLECKKPPELVYCLGFDSATQDEHCESPSRRSLNPESHRSSQHRSRGRTATAFLHPSDKCNRVPNWISLKTQLEKEIGVTGS